MASPHPIPTKLKILNGNPGKQKLNDKEPQPQGDAVCPTNLCRAAKAEWRRITPELRRLGLLTSVDRTALVAYCENYARARDADRIINEQGLTFTTDKGYIMQRPEIAISRACWEMVLKFCVQFGLTPASRSRIHAEPRDKSNSKESLEQFLSETA
jgi:P27 family predicted phage terminase small subunit